MNKAKLFRGITLLLLLLVIGAYAQLTDIANVGRLVPWGIALAIFAGPYFAMALVIVIASDISLLVISWVLIGLNLLAFAYGGFEKTPVSEFVLALLAIVAWVVSLFGCLLSLTPLIEKLSPKMPTGNSETPLRVRDNAAEPLHKID